jgi:hypothetical protein
MNAIQNALNFVASPTGIIILWILLHFVTPHLYVYFCTPATIVGFITSPFIAPAPHCSALRWCIYNSGNFITTMWMLIGSWFIRNLMNQDANKNN